MTKDGNLVVGKGGRVPGRGHIDLTGGQPVQSAGEVRVVNGQLKYMDNASGHYQPSGLGAQSVAEQAFSQLGFDTSGKYIKKAWMMDPSLERGGAWRPVR